MKLSVSKYHGCGNDFIIARASELSGINLPDLAQRACDRHTGIGADGFIAVGEGPLEMIYYNQDGSRAPMCGNGIRCFAAFCHDEQITRTAAYDVQTLAGVQKVRILQEAPFRVQIDMGMPDDDPRRIGISEPIWGKQLTLADGTAVTLYSLFMGTVHTVVFVDDFDADIAEAGRQICTHPLYAEQTNVNFVQVVDDQTMRVRTYERGCGMTLACGTGACAALVCAVREGKMNEKAHVLLEKGELLVELNEQGHVMMSGPAVRVMKGVYEYETDQGKQRCAGHTVS